MRQTSILIFSVAACALLCAGCACTQCQGGDERCPEGTEAKGAAPPEGSELWCESKGKREGFYGKWYEGGQRQIEGAYQEDQKAGVWTEWHGNGQIKSETTWFGGVKDGAYRHYFEDGTPASEGTYSDDREDGRWVTWHKNGKKREEGDMVEGKREGKWTWWTTTGQLDRVARYKNGLEISSKSGGELLPDGGEPQKLVAVDAAGEGGRPDPRCTDGAMLFGLEPPNGTRLWCQKGKLNHGLWLQWWDNGNPWIEGQYEDGRKTGRWIERYENGQKTSEGDFLRDKEHGLWTVWYINGQMRTQGHYNNGVKVGPWKEWHDDGRAKPDQNLGGKLP